MEQHWWRSFDDQALNRLIDTALANNKTLQIAAARVSDAQASRDSAVAALRPDVTGNAGLERANLGYASSNKPLSLKTANVQASWEIDLFGKNQARVRQATALLQSQDASRQAVMVSLLSEVARSYFDLRNIQAQIRITRQSLDTQQRTLDLVKAQMQGALSSELDISRAAAQVATTSAQLPQLEGSYEVALDRLAVLLGATPGTVDQWLQPAQDMTPLKTKVLVAAPAKVMASRPDIRAAERRFAASISGTDAAKREIYPTVSLSALFGVEDSSYFYAKPWTTAGSLVMPILDFGRIQADIDSANAQQKEAFLNYQETVLEADADMEDALTMYLHDNGRQQRLAEAADQNHRAVTLANQQYKAGYTGLLDLLVAQQDELNAKSTLATTEADLRKDLVLIYAAAGGGWDL